MTWKRILLAGDAAELSDVAPEDVGTVAGAGTGAAASREDHVHTLAAGCIDAANLFAAGVVDATALAADSVGASEVIETETFTMAKAIFTGEDPGSEIVLTPKVSSASEVVGTVFYDSDDDHPYVYVT